MGCTERVGNLFWGQQLCRSSAENLDAAPGDVQLSPWAVRAEKLITTLDVGQDRARAEANCLSPAPVRVRCQDWGLGDVPM